MCTCNLFGIYELDHCCLRIEPGVADTGLWRFKESLVIYCLYDSCKPVRVETVSLLIPISLGVSTCELLLTVITRPKARNNLLSRNIKYNCIRNGNKSFKQNFQMDCLQIDL